MAEAVATRRRGITVSQLPNRQNEPAPDRLARRRWPDRSWPAPSVINGTEATLDCTDSAAFSE